MLCGTSMNRNTPFSDDLIFGIPSHPGDELLTEILLVIFQYYFALIITTKERQQTKAAMTKYTMYFTIPAATTK